MMTAATETKKVTCLGGVSRNIVLPSLEKPMSRQGYSRSIAAFCRTPFYGRALFRTASPRLRFGRYHLQNLLPLPHRVTFVPMFFER